MSVYEAMKRLDRDVRRRTLAKCASLALRPYGNDVAAMAGDKPFAVGRKIARAIRRLDKATSAARKRNPRGQEIKRGTERR